MKNNFNSLELMLNAKLKEISPIIQTEWKSCLHFLIKLQQACVNSNEAKNFKKFIETEFDHCFLHSWNIRVPMKEDNRYIIEIVNLM